MSTRLWVTIFDTPPIVAYEDSINLIENRIHDGSTWTMTNRIHLALCATKLNRKRNHAWFQTDGSLRKRVICMQREGEDPR